MSGRSPATLLLVAIMLACAHSPKTPSGGSAEFNRLVDEYFAAVFAWRPSAASDTGLHEHDTELEDLSHERIAARAAELKAFLARLEAMTGPDASPPLSADELMDARAIMSDARSGLLDLETLQVYDKNPMIYAGLPGNAVDILVKRDFAPAADRLRRVIARLEKVPTLYAAARANLHDPPREFTDLAIRMARGSAGFFEGSLATWARQVAADDAALLARFQAANARVIAAAGAFADWLEKDLLPRSHGAYAIGAAAFLAKVKYDEMVELPLEDLLRKGEAQLAKDYAAFVETARAIDATRTPAEVMRALSDDHPSADELLPAVRSSVEAARQFVVDHELVTIPAETRVRVEETPPYARSGNFASMDTPGAYETRAKEAYYYVTPVEPDWDAKHKEEHLRLYNRWVVAMINVHEAYPGHFLQFLYLPRVPGKARKLIQAGTNVEGWAHYVEQMMVDHGYGGGGPKIRLAQLQEALLRDCRYVVGIKLHTQGMKVEEGARVFVEKGFQEPANAYEEARRGAYNPTYLYYTLGKLEIQELAAEWMQKKGGTLREFHDAFVAQGSLPIPLVRQILLR
jgi:uncharacterized protein (DUF885 family)